MKQLKLILVALIVCSYSAVYAQSLGQIGFIVGKAMPDVSSIAVIFNIQEQAKQESEAKSATIIAKKKFTVYPVQSKPDISKMLTSIASSGATCLIVVSDDSVLDSTSVKFLVQKLADKKIAVISNRPSDVNEGALLAITKNGDALEKRLNKKVMGILGLTLSAEFIAECIVAVE